MNDRNLKSCRLPPEVKRLADVVRSCSDFPVHLVGGGVRDMLLGRPPKDLDFLVFGPIDSLARKVARRLGRQAIRIGQAEKLLWRVVGEELEMDFTPPRDSTLEGDLKNRDFTINALAWSLNDDRIVDFVDGVKDLGERCIRMTHPLVFAQDPVRMMRAFRLAGRLDFCIESETLARIAVDKNLIRGAAAERIGMEFLELLRARTSALHVGRMQRIGFMSGALLGRAGAEADAGAWDVTIAALERLDIFAGDVESIFPSHGEGVRRWLSASRNTPLLKLALLLFELGKGASFETGPDTEAATAVERLALSNREGRLLTALLQGLPEALRVLVDASARLVTFDDRTMLRFLRGAGENAEGILFLAVAIAASTEPPGIFSIFLETARRLLSVYYQTYLPRLREPRLLTGEDLKAFGLSPGPVYREILDAAEAARMEGDLIDRNAALSWLHRRMALDRGVDSTGGSLN